MSNYIDTRDLYKRKCELESLRDALKDAKQELETAQTALDEHANKQPPLGEHGAYQEWEEEGRELEAAVSDADEAAASAEADFGTDEEAELAELEALESDMDARAFRDGETMIPERDFEDYARELASDCCDMKHADKWPYTCIDWEQAAKELAMDYSTVTYRGTDYYVRS